MRSPPLFKPFFCFEKSIAGSPFDGGGAHMISRPASSTYPFVRKKMKKILTSVILHFQIRKKKSEAAHFLDARGNEKQVSNLEWPNCETYPLL